MDIAVVLKSILEKFPVESYNFSQKNKIGTITMFVYEPWNVHQNRNEELVDMVKTLEIVNFFTHIGFNMGKKSENKNMYEFIFSLKNKYYDGKIDMSHYNGQMLNLVKTKGIETKEDFYRVGLDLIKNMSDYTHTLKFKEKRKYRMIKLGFISNLYKIGYIESMIQQISYSKDSLILFKTKFGQSLHLRKDDCCYFIPKDILDSLELMPELYFKKDVNVDAIDLEFQKYISLLRYSGEEFIFRNSEILN